MSWNSQHNISITYYEALFQEQADELLAIALGDSLTRTSAAATTTRICSRLSVFGTQVHDAKYASCSERNVIRFYAASRAPIRMRFCANHLCRREHEYRQAARARYWPSMPGDSGYELAFPVADLYRRRKDTMLGRVSDGYMYLHALYLSPSMSIACSPRLVPERKNLRDCSCGRFRIFVPAPLWRVTAVGHENFSIDIGATLSTHQILPCSTHSLLVCHGMIRSRWPYRDRHMRRHNLIWNVLDISLLALRLASQHFIQTLLEYARREFASILHCAFLVF